MFDRLPLLSAATLFVLLVACGGGSEPAAPETSADTSDSEASSATTDGAEPVAAASEEATQATPAEPATNDDEGDEQGFPRPAVTADPKTGFSVNSNSIPTAAGTVIGGINAFCEPADEKHVRFGANNSPHINWVNAPEDTKSFALLVHDPDSPADGEGVNKENVQIPESAERTDFYHWVLVDIPATLTELPEKADGEGVTSGGKPLKKTEFGLRGLNDYTNWFASDPEMKGDYAGYDGPCPPWNDDRAHRYVFTLYALDIPTLGLSGRFTGSDVTAKLEGHVLSESSFTSIYWINPGVSPPKED